MDYVVNYGTPEQFRVSIGVVEISPGSGQRRFAADVNRVGAQIDPIIRATKCETAQEAERLAVSMLEHKYGKVESYQREKHRDLSIEKIAKK